MNTHNTGSLAHAIAILLLLAGSSCKNRQQPVSGKVKEGTEYAIVANGEGETVQLGNWLRLQIVQLYNDSVLRDSHTTGPEYQHYDSASMTRESLRVFAGIHEGDSLSFRVSRDSAFPRYRPDFAKVDGYLVTRVKVEKIFRYEADYLSDRKLSDSLFRSAH